MVILDDLVLSVPTGVVWCFQTTVLRRTSLVAFCVALLLAEVPQREGIPQVMLFLRGETVSFLIGQHGSHSAASSPFSGDLNLNLSLNSLLVTRQMTLFHQGVWMGEKLVPLNA